MADRLPIRFEALSKAHNRASFRCGESALDDWFHKRAGQDERRNVARVFVALDGDEIAGFYSIGAFSLGLAEMPEALAAKLPRYDAIPAALIGRLARDERYRGQNIGELLLADAVHRIVSASSALAVFAIVVDAKNAKASDFYQSFGCIPFPQRPERLFLLTSTVGAAFGKI